MTPWTNPFEPVTQLPETWAEDMRQEIRAIVRAEMDRRFGPERAPTDSDPGDEQGWV